MSSPSKLFSCVQSTEICRSPLNKSSAKQQFSFPKTQRFQAPIPYCDNIYNLPDMKMLRKTNLGLGKKTDLNYGKHRHNITPSPDLYQIKSFVDFNVTHKIGASTHIGRELTTPRSYIELDRIKFPGPGRYEEFRVNKSPKWTMRPKVDDNRKIFCVQVFEKNTTVIVPGSATYNFSQQLNPQGKYSLSKYKSSGSKVWNPKTSERFYKSSKTLLKKLLMFQDQVNTNQSTIFPILANMSFPKTEAMEFGNKINNLGILSSTLQPRQRKVQISIRSAPGPGSYRLPSDFGQYDQIINKSIQ